MKFLTKLGQILLKSVQIVAGIAPVITQQLPGTAGVVQIVSADLAQISTIITNVEAMGQVLGLPGPDKLRASAPLVAQVILQSSMLANHKIADELLFQQGCMKIADGMADVMNSLQTGGIVVTDKT